MSTITIDGEHLSLEQFLDVARHRAPVKLAPTARERIIACRQFLEELTQSRSDEPYYGINTGFGALASRKINHRDLKKLQLNLIRSHAAGVGPHLQEEVARGVMLLRANVLAKGYSGVRLEVVRLLIDFLNHRVVPWIPEKGSVGASGDLAPLSHLALCLIGEGEVLVKGKKEKTAKILKQLGLRPLILQEKEGLALINGTQVMTAQAIFNLLESEKLATIADIAGALTFEAQLGNPQPFAAAIQQVRPHPGQAVSAANILNLIEDSPLWQSHQGREKIQDAYSVRCMPQVHGAVRDTLGFVRRTLEIEANSATENPLIFPEQRVILSGGNFHGEPVALAMDFLAIALTELGNIAERRIDRLVNPASNMGLPHFLIADNGLNSGFMIAHVTASALASENRTRSHPASADNIPTSGNQEDHVSMGSIAARKAGEVVSNTKHILAIEILTASQALDFYQEKSSPPLEAFKKEVRRHVPFLQEDRRLDELINRVTALIDNGRLLEATVSTGIKLK